MRWVVIFEDTPRMAAVRERLDGAHVDYLRVHQNEIVIAGGLREVPGGAYVGGLWVLEVASRQRAVELIEADPYYREERRPYRLLVWGKAVTDVDVTL